MRWKMWMVDLAREQAVTLDHLYRYASVALDSGYRQLGLYVEHRFAYPSAPWATGKASLTPEMVKNLQSEFPSLEIVPFINLLGHVEGFIYAQEGRNWRAEKYRGLQASPSAPGFQEFVRGILEDTMRAFSSEMIHIGGDETSQLDAHPRDRAKAEATKGDGKAAIYADHFGPLIERVVQEGRVPGLWADMALEHPGLLSSLPREAVLFDWQYDQGLGGTSPRLKEAGFQVVGSPTLHVYNAPWMHLNPADANVRQVSQDVQLLGLDGVCLTTWEFGLFSAADTLFPAVQGASEIIDSPSSAPHLLESYPKDSGSREWADLMGVRLPKLGSPFGYPSIRSPLKCRFLLWRNPFLLWTHHADELRGEVGLEAIQICTRAMAASTDEGEKGVCHFVRSAVEFCRMADEAADRYDAGEIERAISCLAPTRQLFDDLEKTAKKSLVRIGGSLADPERCRAAKEHVEVVIKRLRQYGEGQLGYRPAFDILTNPRFVPHDQGAWWLINRWGND
jgi:hypothetical protein